MPALSRSLLLLALAALVPAAAFAQTPPAAEPAAAAGDAPPAEAMAEAPMTPEQEEAAMLAFFESLGFKPGGATVGVGSHGDVAVPEDFLWADPAGTRALLDATRNLPNGRELTTLLHKKENYFIIFQFDDVGYVKDDDADELDADAMLKSLREGQAEANKQLKARGDSALEVTGWHAKPHYDQATHNLEWAPILKNVDSGGTSVNYNVRILGRRGVMEAQLVASPDQMAEALPALREILKGYAFRKGQDYASFTAGDKVAEYGLAALVVGGGAALAAKSGLLGKLLKPIIAGVAILVGAVGSFFKKIFGGKSE